ncbi:MAG: transglutaminase family protein, partial [Pseudomonadota bacterium]
TGGRKELSYEDHNNNVVELISFDRDSTELIVESQGEVSLEETHGIVGRHRGPVPLWLFQRTTPRTKAGAGCRKLIRDLPDASNGVEHLHALSRLVRDQVTYKVGASEADWTAEEALASGQGVCQDHAHVFVACARELGYPARYVSGYLMLNDRVEQEAAHAWAEVHVNDLGWVGFDVSNGISPDNRYVRVATGLDYSEAAPVTGTRVGGDGEDLTVELEVAQQ